MCRLRRLLNELLDVPMHIHLVAKQESGWHLKELPNPFYVDYRGTDGKLRPKKRSHQARNDPRYAGKVGVSRRPPHCHAGLGIGVKPAIGIGSRPSIGCEASDRARHGTTGTRGADQACKIRSFDASSGPRSYQMWRTPALDVVVSAGVTYAPSGGAVVDQESSLYASGEIAHLLRRSTFD